MDHEALLGQMGICVMIQKEPKPTFWYQGNNKNLHIATLTTWTGGRIWGWGFGDNEHDATEQLLARIKILLWKEIDGS